MAGDRIVIKTEQVSATADRMDRLREELASELQASRRTVNSLREIWRGQAAEKTISSFNAFADRYYEQYQETIKRYTAFLRQNIEAGYIETERANTSLAGS